MISNAPNFSGGFVLRGLPGSSILASYGVLGTLVVAVQLHARALRRSGKRRHPGPTEFLDWMCWIILLAVCALTTVSITQHVALGTPPNPARIDILGVAGSFVFGALIALFASDAAEHAKLLEGQSRSYDAGKVSDAAARLAALPKGRPSSSVWVGQLILLAVACPALSCAAAAVWVGPQAVFPTFVGSLLTVVAVTLHIPRLCAFWYAKKWWSLAGSLLCGWFYWVLLGLAFLMAGLDMAAEGRFGTEAVDVFGKLLRPTALYVLVTALPFYVGLWMCGTSSRGRGFMAHLALRRAVRHMHKLRHLPLRPVLPRHLLAVRRILGQGLKGITTVHRRSLTLILLCAIGVALAVVIAWLSYFGPHALASTFPDL
ncbi:hypothetical protein [Paenarthrobacter sp. NPDC058040]|uniref:hypothetical protein n=1 Tax=unclassified Paenarthrobacter TaxID=2634190 RepID=UPI0036DE3665